MPPGLVPQSMKMSDSPFLRGQRPSGLGSCLIGSWARWLTGQPPEAFGFFPPFLGGIFAGEIAMNNMLGRTVAALFLILCLIHTSAIWAAEKQRLEETPL